jgi:hypothetical protein
MIGFAIGLVIELVALMISLLILLLRLLIRGSVLLVALIAGAVQSHRGGPAKLPAGRQALDPDLRWAVFQRDGYACVHCGSRSDLTVDHVRPVLFGGENSPENLQTLCRSCNSRKGVRV